MKGTTRMFTKSFWKSAAERAGKSAGQFGLFAWGATAWTAVGDVVPTLTGVGLAMGFGAGLSLLTSLASAKVGDEGTPSLVTGGE